MKISRYARVLPNSGKSSSSASLRRPAQEPSWPCGSERVARRPPRAGGDAAEKGQGRGRRQEPGGGEREAGVVGEREAKAGALGLALGLAGLGLGLGLGLAGARQKDREDKQWQQEAAKAKAQAVKEGVFVAETWDEETWWVDLGKGKWQEVKDVYWCSLCDKHLNEGMRWAGVLP